MDYKLFTEKSINYLASYIENNKLQSLVLGISGGIDSTVVAAIASESCKKTGTKLIGRSLPAHTNNPDEINTATLVGQAFCDDFKEVAIEKIYAKVADEFELNEGKMSTLQLGNIKARLRMMYLYNLASIHRGCVLDTDNRTEHELGFWTIHGDVGDLNCGLIYLWKTEVYEVARYLMQYHMYREGQNTSHSEQSKAICESIKLVPTDGNGVMSGGDCAQFGLDNYNQVDDVLKTMYFSNIEDETEKANEYIRLIDSYNEQGVDKVMVRHQNSAFKRLPQPIYPNKEELGL
jgi:NAD+ synthetase